MHTPDRFATIFVAIVWAIWLAYLLGWIVKKSRVVSDTGEWFRRHSPMVCALALAALLGLASFAVDKNTGNALQGFGVRPPVAFSVPATQPEAASLSLAVVSVWTNGVTFRTESTNAVEITAFRTVGGTELGDWIETTAPFFAVGTNSVSRCYVSASGSVSFDSMRRPPVGSTLPDGTGLPVLCPLRAHLGFVPEANWHLLQTGNGQPETGNGGECRFWHDALPGGGKVLTWEDTLVDRLPGRCVSFQVELHPSGDCVYRYDFKDALDTPATNFVVGAQFGTNGVNALSILGTNTLAATVWNVDGAPVTNGVSIADLLCTNGVLRTPASFEIRWKNTTGLDPDADTDDDGLTDWAETFLWGTEAGFADTDGDGRSDGDEIAWGDDPFDADENGDGVPDGMDEEEWLANLLWAANSTNGANVVVSLNAAVPQGTSATLILGDLAIPLRSPGTWAVSLVPGQMYDFRLKTNGRVPVDITLMPPEAGPLETGGQLRSMSPPPSGMNGGSPVWVNPKDALNGPTGDVAGNVAAPILSVVWVRDSADSHDSIDENICLHSEDEWAMFQASVLPNGMGITAGDLTCRGLTQIGTGFGLRMPDTPGTTAEGSILLGAGKLRGGSWLQCDVSAHRMAPSQNGSHCAVCDFYGVRIDDVSLHVRSPLTLKHDNVAAIAFHCEKPDHGQASNPAIRIRRVGTTEWHTLAQSFSHLWTAKIAGFFELKGVATMDGDTFETAPVAVEVQYPDYDEIFTDDDVIAICTNVWSEMKRHCTETERHEAGCWIFLDTQTEKYLQGEMKIGDAFDADGTASVRLPIQFLEGEIAPSATSPWYCYPVATIHAHTPTEHRSTGRDVGPSGPDISRARNALASPCAVFDYLPSFDPEKPNDSNRIPAHHPADSPGKIWKIDFPDRRPTPRITHP